MEPVSFMCGVIAGEGACIVMYIFWRNLNFSTGQSTGHIIKKSNKPTCPYCGSKKLAYTEKPGILWCQICGKENDGTTKVTKTENNPTN